MESSSVKDNDNHRVVWQLGHSLSWYKGTMQIFWSYAFLNTEPEAKLFILLCTLI